MDESKRPLVQKFLNDYKLAAKQSFTLIRRQDNEKTLVALGLTVKDCKNEILSLSAADILKEPEDDRDKEKGGTVWFFGKRIRGREIYIKIKLIEAGGRKSAVCISFHFAEEPLDYPLQEK